MRLRTFHPEQEAVRMDELFVFGSMLLVAAASWYASKRWEL